jgi:phytoene dehydrogenase-like protein
VRRSIIVVGGGPAGLAAAAWLADRGDEVTVFDREAELGGASRHCAGVRRR